MSGILEVPAVRRQVARISVQNYHAMSELGMVSQRAELLRGVIVEKMTKSPTYVLLVRPLYDLAQAAGGSGCNVRKEEPLTLADSEPEPDIAVVAGSPEDYRDAHPATALLVVEVAISTEELDRQKTAIYAEAAVAEYWLVLPASGVIEIYSRPDHSIYKELRVARHGDRLVSSALPGLQLNVSDLFA